MDNTIKFEAFRAEKLFTDYPFISIMNNGGIGFSKGFLQKFGLWGSQFVAFRYAEDPENILVGFSFSENDDLDGGLKLYIPKPKTMYAAVSGLRYFKRYKIDFKAYVGKHLVVHFENEEFGTLYIIRLPRNKPVTGESN